MCLEDLLQFSGKTTDTAGRMYQFIFHDQLFIGTNLKNCTPLKDGNRYAIKQKVILNSISLY